MLRAKSKAKLICGIISSKHILSRTEELLRGEFGQIDGASVAFPFDFTDYYDEEMGKDLWRKWVSFEKPISQDDITRMKLTTIRLEKSLARDDGSRTANLDPGYLTSSKVVLATTKDYSHRLYLGQGIFAEVALIYERGGFRPLDWTYPDYRRDDSLRFFKETRDRLKAKLSG